MATAIIGTAVCASAWADAGNMNVVAPKRAATDQKVAPKKKVKIYVHSTASAIPLPIEQFEGIPTTMRPISIMGRASIVGRSPTRR